MITKRITLAFATASLALGFVASPVAFNAASGLKAVTAAAKEAESGGRHAEAGDDKGGNRGGGNGGQNNGGRGGDDHPGSHSQNGKNK